FPLRALSRTSLTCVWYSLVMNSSASRWPSVSLFSYPVMATAVLFHSVTRPSRSMPKIGAFAVSIKFVSSWAIRDDSTSAFLRSVMSAIDARTSLRQLVGEGEDDPPDRGDLRPDRPEPGAGLGGR